MREFKATRPGRGPDRHYRHLAGRRRGRRQINDIVVEIETAKSLVELPIPYAGPSPRCWWPRGDGRGGGRRSSSPTTGPAKRSGRARRQVRLLARRQARRRGRGAAGGGGAAGRAAGRGSGGPGAAGREAAASGRAAIRVGPGDSTRRNGSASDFLTAEVACRRPDGSGTREAGRTPVLVGYGVKTGSQKRRRGASLSSSRRSHYPDEEPAVKEAIPSMPTRAAVWANSSPRTSTHVFATGGRMTELTDSARGAFRPVQALANPLRKLARDLRVDLAHVAGSGDGGIITRDDVLTHRRRQLQSAAVRRRCSPAAVRVVAVRRPGCGWWRCGDRGCGGGGAAAAGDAGAATGEVAPAVRRANGTGWPQGAGSAYGSRGGADPDQGRPQGQRRRWSGRRSPRRM